VAQNWTRLGYASLLIKVKFIWCVYFISFYLCLFVG